ncbi:LTA synthase family protein [Helicobacter sp. MIT 21-1697]|uniref:LTA synthase family protein n=1 Tax=Helicobacter sp. MIT 21-1697 TaxID=2993733 RepID=UPI00224B49F9|nr:LTA synthase family protein [Helicobacter sp. MIT 21-1697]MCX2717508.1 LTA synthase family protein [Helicobacter sp. MIT 21-1697]
MVAGIINFYYFRTYGNKIDVFIFGLKDDDTLAILQIMWQDYPVLLGVCSAFLFGLLTLYIYKIPTKMPPLLTKLQLPYTKLRPIQSILAHLLLIICLIIAARGSLGTFPITSNNYYISTLPIFNHLATNPLLALDWAYKDYKANAHFTPPSPQKGENLQKALFPLLHKSADSVFLKHNPPHIVLNLMESFGSNMLVYDEFPHNDLLGSLRKHFKEDFVFYKFLSGTDGTAGSFAALFFNSPTAHILRGATKNTPLPYNPFSIYANAGYEVIYITSGYASWQNLGEFITIQGAHHIYDALSLMERFPQSKIDKNAYGIPDEYAYKFAFEILENAQKPTFIAILTTSNHPPYHLPHNYTSKPIALNEKFKTRTTDESRSKIKIFTLLYQYANDAFGNFMDNIKNSSLGKNTIVAASGDHRLRDFIHNPSTDKALYHAVPLYLYVPQDYAHHIHYDPTRVGSHKDILPTLYELSLSNTQYMSLGGRNILAKEDNEKYAFGYNASVWIDREGIYPILSDVGYKWEDSHDAFGLLSTDTQIHLSPYKKAFGSTYQELFDYSIAWRIFNPQLQNDSH